MWIVCGRGCSSLQGPLARTRLHRGILGVKGKQHGGQSSPAPTSAKSARGKQTTSWESQSRTEKIKLCV